MFLFHMNPKDYEVFETCYSAEFLFVVIDYLLILPYLKIVQRARIHLNIKMMALFFLFHYAMFLTARIIILLDQGYFILHLDVQHEPSNFIVASSVVQGSYYLLILTSIFWLSIERVFARYYIRQYDITSKLWIPGTISTCAALFSFLGSAAFIFEWLQWFWIVAVGFVLLFLGVALIWFCNNNAVVSHRTVRKMSMNPNDGNRFQTLKLKSQLEDNIWCTKLLKTGCFTIGAVIFVHVPAFIGAYSPDCDQETRDLLVCLLHIFTSLAAPLMPIIGFLFDRYLRRLMKSLFCAPIHRYKDQEEGGGRIYSVNQQRPNGGVEEVPVIQLHNFVPSQ